MKNISKTGIYILCAFTSLFLWSCAEEDENYIFEHSNNLISQLVCKADVNSADGYAGQIYEYDRNDNMVEGKVNPEDVEGGYGIIVFKISRSLQDLVDLTSVYLVANVDLDAIITPSLGGKHNITGDGILITVKSGVGKTREYRVKGEYE